MPFKNVGEWGSASVQGLFNFSMLTLLHIIYLKIRLELDSILQIGFMHLWIWMVNVVYFNVKWNSLIVNPFDRKWAYIIYILSINIDLCAIFVYKDHFNGQQYSCFSSAIFFWFQWNC